MKFILDIVGYLAILIRDVIGFFNIFKKKKDTEEHIKEVVAVKKEITDIHEKIDHGDIDKLNEEVGWKS